VSELAEELYVSTETRLSTQSPALILTTKLTTTNRKHTKTKPDTKC